MPNTDLEFDEPQTRTATTTAAKTTVNYDDEDVDFGNADVMAKTGLQKFAPKDSGIIRVALLTDVVKPKKAWAHFVTDKGTYRCLTPRDAKGNPTGDLAPCCKALNSDKKQQASMIIAVLALRYTSANNQGRFQKAANGGLPPIEYEIGWVKLSREGYRKVSMLVPEDGAITDKDIFIQNKTNGIGFDYSAPADCLFRKNHELAAEVVEVTEKYKDGKLLSERLGKKITDVEWKALLAGKAATASDAKVSEDLSDL